MTITEPAAVGERIVQRIGIGTGEQVLDVACGSGNVAIRAAQAGGHVVGLDLTPELFDAGRTQAAEAGVTVDWVEGDAEDLPFEDATFDVVLSTFGVMFAPPHEVAARELARVLRPGGRLGLCNWTPEGIQGEFFRTLGTHLPAAPAFAQPPLVWGTPERQGTWTDVREQLARIYDRREPAEYLVVLGRKL